MNRNLFEELYEDIVWEFAERFGKDAIHVFWQANLTINDTEDESIKKFLDEMEHPATEDNINFLKNFIQACDWLEETCEYLAMALGKTLKEYRHQDEIASDIWNRIHGEISNGV